MSTHALSREDEEDDVMGGVSLEDMFSMADEDVDRIMREHREERKRFQEQAFIKLPARPPLVLDCIHFLRVNGGIDTEGIFRVNGDSTAVERITEAFNKDIDIHDILLSVHQSEPVKNFDVATCLKRYFRRLETPLIPYDNYGRMKRAMNNRNMNPTTGLIMEIRRMPQPNRSVLCYLMIFFQDIVDNSEINKMSANNLATCLTMSITRFLDDGEQGNSIGPMLEIGMSTKIISLMLADIDFTEFITPQEYYELFRSTTYKRIEIPDSFAEFLENVQFRRFQPRYGDAMRTLMGPPPVPVRRGSTENKYLN